MNTVPGTSPHLADLIDRIRLDFDNRVKTEPDPSNVLLKGHLLIENILQETLATFDCHKTNRLNKMDFHKKIECLQKLQESNPVIKEELSRVSFLLYSLNEVRNNLAHNLDFKISEQEVDKIGVNLGSEFILYKYHSGHKVIRENLLFCLDKIVHLLGAIIFIKMNEIKRSQAKQVVPITSLETK